MPHELLLFGQPDEGNVVGLGFYGVHALGFLLPRLGDVGGLGEVCLGEGYEMAGVLWGGGSVPTGVGAHLPFS